jgi:hypothetical protein
MARFDSATYQSAKAIQALAFALHPPLKKIVTRKKRTALEAGALHNPWALKSHFSSHTKTIV